MKHTPVRSAPLDAAIADRLLRLLSTDDQFRSLFQNDPRSALESVGYEAPARSALTACGLSAAAPEPLIDCRVNNLASKQDIASAREEILAMLTSGLSQNPPQLDTAVVGLRLK